ncbi:MAG: dTDP-glucose 4,6-dehydratase [Rhodothermales bacterium]
MKEAPLQHEPRSVLVTGGAGFIGSNFLLRVVPRYPDVQFVNLDLLSYAGNLMNLAAIEDAANYSFVHGDVADAGLLASLFEEHTFSTVVHFAAESHVDRSIKAPLAFVRTNTVGTVTLLEAAREAWPSNALGSDRFRFYHISTDEVYGSLGDDGAFSERTPYDPRSPYSASKASSDHFVRAYHHTYGLPIVISNCSNNYGPFQFPEKLIPLVLVRAKDRKSIPIYGTGENVRDWLFVEDHCEAIEMILRAGTTGETYAVGGGTERTNIDLVETLLDIVDRALEREPGSSRRLIEFVADRPGHDYRYAMDFGKLQHELGWQPRHDLDAGLSSTVDWYLEHPAWLDAVLDDTYRRYYDEQYAGRG